MEQLLRVSEVAQVLGISRSKAYGLAARKIIPVIRIEGVVRVPAKALARWIEQRVQGGQGQ